MGKFPGGPLVCQELPFQPLSFKKEVLGEIRVMNQVGQNWRWQRRSSLSTIAEVSQHFHNYRLVKESTLKNLGGRNTHKVPCLWDCEEKALGVGGSYFAGYNWSQNLS